MEKPIGSNGKGVPDFKDFKLDLRLLIKLTVEMWA